MNSEVNDHEGQSAISTKPKPKSQSKVALAGLKGNSSGQYARDVVNITSHNHDSTNLANGPAKTSQSSSHQCAPTVPDQVLQHAGV